VLVVPDEKACTRCGGTKLIGEFPSNRAKPDGHGNVCKSCTAARTAALILKWREEHPEEAKKLLKECCGCKQVKPVAGFHKNKTTRDGYSTFCKKCQKLSNAKWEKNNPEKVDKRRKDLRAKTLKAFGLDTDAYLCLLGEQEGCCAVCGVRAQDYEWRGKKGARFCIDHDHKTGKIRGLLCHACNLGVGHLRDDPELLDLAAAYLRSFDNTSNASLAVV
jgi:hypothetical protein